MTTVSVVIAIYGIILMLAAIPTVYRMIVGPTVLDRAVASDMAIVLTVIAMALYTAQTRSTWAFIAMLSLTGLAFLGTVGVARFVAREEPRLSARTARIQERNRAQHTEYEPVHSMEDRTTALSGDGEQDEQSRGGTA